VLPLTESGYIKTQLDAAMVTGSSHA
jgi:hypothetical protein